MRQLRISLCLLALLSFQKAYGGGDAWTATCVDSFGRVWRGTYDAGVCIDAGDKGVRFYNALSGPVSDRIYDIACSPSGVMAIGTAAGVSIYDSTLDKWYDITVLQGLPVGGVTRVAFDRYNSLWMKNECGDVFVSYASELSRNVYRRKRFLVEKDIWRGGKVVSCDGGFPSVSTTWKMPVAHSRRNLTRSKCIFVGDDWTVKGDWCERYGWSHALLCAMNSPCGDEVYYEMRDAPDGVFDYDVHGSLGTPHVAGDSIRRWIHWASVVDEKRDVLWMPRNCFRREAEWDDHGEAYLTSMEGPGLEVSVKMPSGINRIDLYFYNPNPDSGAESNRNYRIEVGLADGDGKFSSRPAVAYVNGFERGVFKRFLTYSSGEYKVKLFRNNSFNTILNGVFISPYRIEDVVADKRRFESPLCGYPFPKRPLSAVVKGEKVSAKALEWWVRSWEDGYEIDGPIMRLYALRAALAESPECRGFIALVKWEVPYMDEDDHVRFLEIMKGGE